MLLLLSLKFHFVSCTRLDKAFFQLLLLFCSVLCLSLPSASATAVVTAGAPTPVGRSMMLPFGFFVVHAAALRFCYESCRSIALLVANYNFPHSLCLSVRESS